MRYVGKTSLQETWIVCWSSFQKNTASFPARGAFLQSKCSACNINVIFMTSVDVMLVYSYWATLDLSFYASVTVIFKPMQEPKRIKPIFANRSQVAKVAVSFSASPAKTSEQVNTWFARCMYPRYDAHCHSRTKSVFTHFSNCEWVLITLNLYLFFHSHL